MKITKVLSFLVIMVIVFSCTEDKKSIPPPNKKIQRVQMPNFNPDSAYQFIKNQVDFGPRVPNSEGHKACAKYLENELNRFGFQTEVQQAKVKAYDDTKLNIFNIMGRYNPDSKNRILLFAHWDTRHIADRDTEKTEEPILGADDGGSGVGVLLEIARVLNTSSEKPKVGIDIVFFDAEDYGQPNNVQFGLNYKENTWCLGSQYWSKNMPWRDSKPKYGILLDMVGAADAMFPKEAGSIKYANHVVEKVWAKASQLGYEDYFTNDIIRGGITDDHLYINAIAGIPSIDIIHYDITQSDFGSFHHRHSDNMDVIHKPTLQIVGEVLMNVIYTEN